jgi:hypothetical protein
MRNNFRFFALSWILVACSGSGVTSPAAPSPVGAWGLASVNGHALPTALYSVGTTTTDIVGGNLILRLDRTYASSNSTRPHLLSGQDPAGNPDVAVNLGSWDLTSGDLTVGVSPAVLTGNVLIVRWSSTLLFAYQRQ